MQIAKRQGVVNPENTFFSVKRFIGRKMNEVGEESKQVPYRVSLIESLDPLEMSPCNQDTQSSCGTAFMAIVHTCQAANPPGSAVLAQAIIL